MKKPTTFEITLLLATVTAVLEMIRKVPEGAFEEANGDETKGEQIALACVNENIHRLIMAPILDSNTCAAMGRDIAIGYSSCLLTQFHKHRAQGMDFRTSWEHALATADDYFAQCKQTIQKQFQVETA